jgi:hypothetical protein
MYTLSMETSGQYVIEDLTRTIESPEGQLISVFRLSYYQATWLTDVTSTIFYVGLSGNDNGYTYSLDTKVWFDTLAEMVGTLRKWVLQGDKIVDRPIELSPLRSRVSLKMMSGDMLSIEIDYCNVDRTPYQQIKMLLRESGLMINVNPLDYAVIDENGVKNLQIDVLADGSEMNILVQ